MGLLPLLVLAVVQGITEFLPISSSAHLILTREFAGWPDPGTALDVAVHIGTLLAVLIYFWRDVWAMIRGVYRMFSGRMDAHARLALLLIVATIPLGGAAWYVHTRMPEMFRSVEVIGWATLGFGILLYVVDKATLRVRRVEHATIWDAILIGLCQVLALIPGTSRSGITMTGARLLGFERPEAARFSMLMSIPAIGGIGAMTVWELLESGDPVAINEALIGGGLAFVTALLAIAALMAWLARSTFTPFVIYRVILGCVLLALAYL